MIVPRKSSASISNRLKGVGIWVGVADWTRAVVAEGGKEVPVCSITKLGDADGMTCPQAERPTTKEIMLNIQAILYRADIDLLIDHFQSSLE